MRKYTTGTGTSHTTQDLANAAISLGVTFKPSVKDKDTAAAATAMWLFDSTATVLPGARGERGTTQLTYQQRGNPRELQRHASYSTRANPPTNCGNPPPRFSSSGGYDTGELSPKSPVGEVASFPQDLVFVGRATVLIRGLSARLGIEWSLAKEWCDEKSAS